MTTFGYAEMRDWAEQSDDPRVKSMWERLSNCRSKIAKWCQAAEYAELRTKNLAAENTALRAEVERLREHRGRQYDQNTEQVVRIAWLEAEVERLREERRWRDAYGELPEPLTEVLVFRRGIGIDRGSWCPEQEEWYADDGDWFSPTHWMPLPAPPDAG